MKMDKKNAKKASEISEEQDKNKDNTKETTDINPKDIQIQELTDTIKRLQADFENYKKRIEREKEQFVGYSCENIIKKILPFLDSFELSLKNSQNHEDFLKGIELIYSQLWEILEKEGLEKIKAEGEMFNPEEHEALLSQQSEAKENTILEELQKGYMLKGKIIRPTKVKVAKK